MEKKKFLAAIGVIVILIYLGFVFLQSFSGGGAKGKSLVGYSVVRDVGGTVSEAEKQQAESKPPAVGLVRSSIVTSPFSIRIENIQDKYLAGDSVSFDYVIESKEDVEITYLVNIGCAGEGVPTATEDPKTVVVGPQSPVKETFSYGKIPDDAESQQCEAYVNIKEPTKFIRNFVFELEGKKTVDVQIELCGDEACAAQSSVFITNKPIYIRNMADGKGEVTAYLQKFNGKREPIVLPYIFTPTQSGTYILEVETNCDDCLKQSKEIYFGVIDKKPAFSIKQKAK